VDNATLASVFVVRGQSDAFIRFVRHSAAEVIARPRSAIAGPNLGPKHRNTGLKESTPGIMV